MQEGATKKLETGAIAVVAGKSGESELVRRIHSSDDELRMPFSDARLRLAYGTYLRQQGERRGASSQLSRALEIFSALGAHPFAERAETEIVALGLRPRRRGVAAPTLTAREHAVARLVGEGLTNREIANRLIVSVKTVEYHLGNAFTKLGVRSRAQLAARMAKADPD